VAGAHAYTKNNHQDNAHERAADATFPTWCATIAGSNGMASTQAPMSQRAVSRL
jgi:hypothetical protein